MARLQAKIREGHACKFTDGDLHEGLDPFERVWEHASEDDRAELLRLKVAGIVYEGDALKVAYYVTEPARESKKRRRRG